MATRLIGTDSTNPRLPALVIGATQGTTHDDLAPGDLPALEAAEALEDAKAYTDTGLIDLRNYVDAELAAAAIDPAVVAFADTAQTVAGDLDAIAVSPVAYQGALPMLDVRSYGVVGDGVVDDTPALQAAIDAAGADRVVWLPPGTFRLNGARHGTFNALLTFGAGTKIVGSGESSTLKVADGYTAAGDYRIFAPAAAEDTSNVIFHRFRIDGNGANNLVLGSTGGNVRQAYAIYVDRGTNVTIDEVAFINHPGRNVIVLGNNSNPPSISLGRITNCRFVNVGGAIAGNENQNDHSTVYVQFARGVIADNDFFNSNIVDPGSPTKVVTALEIHGSRTVVRGNRVTSFTHGGNAVAGICPSISNTWSDNKFSGLTKLGINIWTLPGFTHSNLTIRGNVFGMYPDLNTVLAGIYQSDLNASTAGTVRNLMIVDNIIEADYTTPLSGAWHGINLTAVAGGTVSRNLIRNTQGDGIILYGHTQAAIDIADVTIIDNEINNAGFHTLANRLWGILLLNGSATGARMRRIWIAGNTITKPSAAGGGRGLSIQGAGRIEEVTFTGLERISNIANPTSIASNTASNAARVAILPKIQTELTANTPTSGIWLVGDQVLHTNVAASGTIGKVCVTIGGASSGVWAATTAYTLGAWIRTSGNKTLECIVAGTSGGTEPNPTTLGDPVTDGTVTWAYRASTVAAFKTFGTVAA